ncbi:MAG: hypothetical protein OEY85_13515 [Rhodospirillales bacterium]|nr:hypothetical protein [Rhodospirillales bacterium]
MNTQPEPEDSAWVSIETHLGENELKAFCRDIERLYRINSLLEFKSWRPLPDGGFRVIGRNLGNGHNIETDFHVSDIDGGLVITYSGGLKTRTLLRFEPLPAGTKLTITDDYSGTPESERQERLDEVDNTLLPWGNDLKRYLDRWQRWSWFAPYRWYMTRFWQTMKPSARRIAKMIFWITVAEFVVFLFVFVIFWLERYGAP